MTEYLYRFRSIENLLGRHEELEQQEIYFASPDQLNDPVEGYKNIFWTGDPIVWKNLLKHYLLCLEHVCSLFIVGGEDYQLTESDIPVFKTEEDFPTPKYKDLYDQSCALFFKNKPISQYPEWLHSRTGAIRNNELSFHLKQIHFFALNSIFTVYEKNKLIPKRPKNNALHRAIKDSVINKKTFDLINQGEAEHPEIKDFADKIYAAQQHVHLGVELESRYNNPILANDSNKYLVLQGFPQKYIQQLAKLLHSEWYTACFLEDYTNPAIWGHYGDNHQGVCLKFKTTPSDFKPYIKLHGINGWGGSKKKSGPTYGDVNHHFYRIKYASKYPEIDFFRSLGRLTMPSIHSWYRDQNNNKSTCADDVFKCEEEWREAYWDNFYKSITTKLEDWRYEGEHRLILSSSMTDYSSPATRKLKYKFKDLDGIIFGMKTSEKDKLSILKIIEEKCRAEGRDDFKFYQAYYSTPPTEEEVSRGAKEVNLKKKIKYAIQGGLSDDDVSVVDLEISEEIKKLQNLHRRLSGYTHINDQTFDLELNEQEKVIGEIKQIVQEFTSSFISLRQDILDKVDVDYLDELITDSFIMDFHEELSLMGVGFIESSEVTGHQLLSIFSDHFLVLVEGHLGCEHYLGGRKDGVEISGDYPFIVRFNVNISNKKISIEPNSFEFDTSSWYGDEVSI